jgi:hypothetical protein
MLDMLAISAGSSCDNAIRVSTQSPPLASEVNRSRNTRLLNALTAL